MEVIESILKIMTQLYFFWKERIHIKKNDDNVVEMFTVKRPHALDRSSGEMHMESFRV